MTATPDRWLPVDESTPAHVLAWVWGPAMTIQGLHYEEPHRASRSSLGWWSDEDREANGAEKAVEGVTHWRPYLVPAPPGAERREIIVSYDPADLPDDRDKLVGVRHGARADRRGAEPRDGSGNVLGCPGHRRDPGAGDVTALTELLAEHQPRSYYRCRCGWQGDHYDVHLHDVLIAAANRTALVDGLAAAGVLVPAGCWDAPDVTDEQIAELEQAVEDAQERFRAAMKAAEDADPPIPELVEPGVLAGMSRLDQVTARENRLMDATSDEWEAYEHAINALDERRELQERVVVFYEDEDRPEDAVPLLKIGPAS